MPSVIPTPRFTLGSFSVAGSPVFSGVVLEENVIAVEGLRPVCQSLGLSTPASNTLFGLLQEWPNSFHTLDTVVAELRNNPQQYHEVRKLLTPIKQLKVHAPLDRPRQVLCCGANYFRHVVDLIVAAGPGGTPETQGMTPQALRSYAENLMRERSANGEPYMFCKPAATISGPYDPITLPIGVTQPDWELELAVVIGRPARHVSRHKALDYVAGYTIANDITNRDKVWRRDDMKAMGTDWIASKGSATYLPLGPYLIPAPFVDSPQDLRLELKLNGEIKQAETTADMIFDVARQIEYLSSQLQLYPGDIICTGSPAGNGAHYQRYLKHGDVLESSISGFGYQRNECFEEQRTKS
ncbi:fumarylacetoacetate hydrolase family protein [Pseudomonas sp. PB101]|uniref:fumarylacetoacetate hydrolase family protein n=1 Tax=Pseudomonas sp. PB101 TaxID=2495428 RepID=UPI00136569D7|nr:fumarylacetoacetate hydrolase family protein [Pseudomonas sp. PB101]MVW84809.1 fumarylacetoacetate hydrolase family protein [Pseudomonas sp. PB101]